MEDDAFLNFIVKTVTNIKQQEAEEGEDSKTILCAFFKEGVCKKGDNCIYSHDMNVNFNQGALDIYTDLRDVNMNNEETEINKIAEEKDKKRSKLCQSKIVCRYFLEAVSKKIYGFKWECPNGIDCQYRHYLPKGYVIQTKEDRIQEEMTAEEFINFEEQIDEERNRVAIKGIPVNDTTFGEWKKKKR